jgi:hypothetical protein
MNKTLDYIIPANDDFYEQKLYDFRLYNNGIVFCYSNNILNYVNILTYNVFKVYTLEYVYIQNISDSVFVHLISKFSDQKYITIKDIKYILLEYKLELNIDESRLKEWDFLGFSKWIVCK